MDHENQELSPTVSQSGEPQEVVLRYEARVTPIVERYVQPTPLPGQPKKDPPRKKRKGLKIFLFCMLGGEIVCKIFFSVEPKSRQPNFIRRKQNAAERRIVMLNVSHGLYLEECVGFMLWL